MFAPPVFFIDDEQSILNAVARLLRGAPLALRCFNDASEALKAAETEVPATVVSDFRMPTMDGIRLLELFKESCPGTTRILLTGYVDLETAVAAINRGSVMRLIKKPWDDAALKAAVLSGLATATMAKATKALPCFLEKLMAVGSLEAAVEALTSFLGEESGLMLPAPANLETPSKSGPEEPPLPSACSDAPEGRPFPIEIPAPESAAFEAAGLGPALADLVESALGGFRLAAMAIEARAGLVELSERDPLTGLYNRRAMRARMEAERARLKRTDRPFSILVMDIDDFKGINDRYGHATGDAAISGIGIALRESCREIDFPARLGGDEFLVGLPETDGAGARILAERVESLAAETGARLGLESGLSLSIGIAVAAAGAFEVDAIIEAADSSMYAVKRSGKRGIGPAMPAMPA